MVDFTYSRRVGSEPLLVDFTDTSVGTYTYRKWVFGDGECLDGNDLTASHIYKQPGVYSPILIAGNISGQESIIKENAIYVNENIEDTKVVVAHSKDPSGKYWKFYVNAEGKLVFETDDYLKSTDSSVVMTNRWMFLEYHVEEDKFYIGSYATGRRHKVHTKRNHSPELDVTISSFFKIAPNSSYIIDELKIWEEDLDLYPYLIV